MLANRVSRNRDISDSIAVLTPGSRIREKSAIEVQVHVVALCKHIFVKTGGEIIKEEDRSESPAGIHRARTSGSRMARASVCRRVSNDCL